MYEYLEDWQVKELTDKRPKLKELLEMNLIDGVKLDLWQVDTLTAGKKPLLLLARYDYGHLGQEYKIIMSQSGKNGSVYSWECPANMPWVKPEPKKNQGGRPKVYGAEAVEKAKALRDEKKLSIRQIAKEMNCSTFTVQRLLK